MPTKMQKYCPLCKVIKLYETCDKKLQSLPKYGKVWQSAPQGLTWRGRKRGKLRQGGLCPPPAGHNQRHLAVGGPTLIANPCRCG